MDHLQAIGTFVHIAEAGSLSAAARASGRSLPAVSRSLQQLEQHLGVRLLHRTTRRTHLTEAGVRYLERCKRLLAELEEANTSVSDTGRSLSGPIVMTAPILFGQMHVVPVVTEFLSAHAGASINLVLTDRYADIVDEGLDLAVRIGHLPDSRLLARRLGTVRRVLCAAPAYLARHGTPRAPADLSAHNCLQFSALSPTSYWDLQSGAKSQQVRVQGSFSSNHGGSMIEAACSGLGIVMALSYQVQDHVERGRLRVLLAQFEPAPLPVNVVLPSSRLLPARVRALSDLLVQRLAHKELAKLQTRKRRP